MFCRNCGQAIHDQAYLCVHCGFKVGQRDDQGRVITHFCGLCGAPVKPYQAMCVQCGNLLENPPRSNATANHPTTVTTVAPTNSATTPLTSPNAPSLEQQIRHSYQRAGVNYTTTLGRRKTMWDAFVDSWRLPMSVPAPRHEYWGAWFIHFLINLAWYLLFFGLSSLDPSPGLLTVYSLLFLIYSVVASIVAVILCTRRLHDAGFSGWWQLLGVVALIMCFLPTNDTNNPYRA